MVLQLPFFTGVLRVGNPAVILHPNRAGNDVQGDSDKKRGSPKEKGGIYQELSQNWSMCRTCGQFFTEAEIMCECMCEVPRQIRQCVLKCTDSGMVYFACL